MPQVPLDKVRQLPFLLLFLLMLYATCIYYQIKEKSHQMGALTFKAYSMRVRSWNVQKLSGLDLTDGFAGSVDMYIQDNKIILVEPVSNGKPRHMDN
jgi:hypothetical protein